MPGNEFGERIHNFFGQEGLSQNQHQSQVVDGSWSSFSNGLVANQRQIDPSLISNLKSYITQQSGDLERGQSSNSQYGLNFTQQPIRSEYSRSLLQEHQQPTNGYMHGNLVLQSSPNEEISLGVDVESNRDKLSASGFTPDLCKNPMRFEMGESPVNYDFFGDQQQLNNQLPGMLQPLARHHMPFNDMQLLNPQVNSWQPDLVTGNTNWMHRSISPGVHGSSGGLMITPEHGQTNLMAQQFEPSLYGMPVGGTNSPKSNFSSVQMNRLAAQHSSANRSSSLTNQSISFLNQGDVQDSRMLPRSTYQDKLLFSHTSVPGPDNRLNFESFQQDDSRERNGSVKSSMKVPENINALQSLQKSTSLDPTEEKILFGSDDNLWDAFGNNTDLSLTGNLMSSSSDLYDACPSLQSGSWSALMQSAVAETSGDEPGVHEWADNNTASHANYNIGSRAQNLGAKASNTLSERLHSDFTRTDVQHLHDKGHDPLEKPMGQHSQMAGNSFHSSSSGIDGQNNLCSIRKIEGIEDRFGIWKAASNPNLDSLNGQKNHFTQNLQMQRARYGFGITGAGNDPSASRDFQGNIQQCLDNNSVEKAISQVKSRDGSKILESYVNNNAGKAMGESNEIGNSKRENSNDSFQSKSSQQSFTCGFKENTQVNSCDLSMLPGGKDTQISHVGNWPMVSRKFQYHPMGNIDVTDEPCREKISHFPPTLDQVSVGNQGYSVQSCMGSENSPSTSFSADRSVDKCNQAKSASSRQTMLDLLHKVDQSQEHSLETNVLGIPEAKISAEYGGQFRHSPSSASQGFSLQLAPPSQPAPSPDNVQFSRNALQPFNSLHTASEKGGTSQSRFAPWASNQSFPQQSTYQGSFPGVPRESTITSGFPYSRYHQNQLMPVATGQSAANTQVKERDECSDIDQRGHSAQTPSLQNPITHRDSAEGFPMLSASSQPLVASSSPQPSSSSGMMSDSRTGISAPQHRFWNSIGGSFSRQEKTNQLSSQNGGDVSLSGRDMVMHELQSKDMGAKQTSDVATMFSKMAQSNLQTIDRFLPSNNLPKDSLSHDEDMAGNGEGNEPMMTVKRIEDSAVDPKVAPKWEQHLSSTSDCLVRNGLNHKDSVNHTLHFGQTVSQSFSNKNHPTSAGADYQQISPQMAPSWYNQYGTFKNGLVQPMNDTGRFTPLKIGEQSSNFESSVDDSHPLQSSKPLNTADHSYIVHMQKMSSSTPGEQTPSSELLPQDSTSKLLKTDTDKPKKRKTATSELLPWNQEVIQGPHKLKTLGESEVDWARATNRFTEKVEFESLFENAPPIKSKRRLICTTQLMQQLFRLPLAKLKSLVASSSYEFVAYTASRAALGDACSSTSTDRNDHFSSKPLSKETKTEKISDLYISKAAEDFISKTQKLEIDFAVLEKGNTIPDMRVEVQDLEKFAVINRFARFHPSSSSDRTASSFRLNPQRYVTIAPMPQNIPDMVQCLSL